MTASMAGVARMIERLETLDLKAKRSTQSGEDLSHGGETSNLIAEGKGVLDHLIVSSRKNCVVKVGDSNLHEISQATCSLSSHKDVSCAESIKLDKLNAEAFKCCRCTLTGLSQLELELVLLLLFSHIHWSMHSFLTP